MSFKVPSKSYFGDGEFRAELEDCLQNYWLFACPKAIVNKPGDFFVFKFLEKEYVIRRAADGKLAGFYNYCKHRGHKLYSQRAGNSELRCPYHGWLYGDDNRLAKLPWNDKCYHIDTTDVSLDCDFILMEKFGLVWIYLGNKNPEDVVLAADGITRELDAFSSELGGACAIVASRQRFNWRLIFDNLYDRVHPSFLHAKSLMRFVSLDFDPYPNDYVVDGKTMRSVLANIAQTGKRHDSNVSQVFTDSLKFETGAYINGHIYPYLHFFTPDGGRLFCYESYLPVSSIETEVNIFWVANGHIGKAQAASLIQAFIYGGAAVLGEDWDAVKSITASVNKPEYYTYGAHEKNAVALTRINKYDF